MVWIVIDENPWPDMYVPIYARPAEQATDIANKEVNVHIFSNENEAMGLAKDLQKKYKAKSIRVFYSQSFSKTV